MITYNLALLRTFGITDVVINLHHHGDALRAALGDGAAFGLQIRYSPEDPLLDTGGGIKHAEGFLAGDDFLVLNSDTIIDLPLDHLIASHRARGAAATLVVRHDPDQERYGLIELDASERIRRLRGEPANASADLTPFMFAGVHVISPQVFRFMPAGGAFSITHETYPAMIAADAALYGYPFAGFWRVIDTPADRERAGAELATTRFEHLRPKGA